MTIGDKIKKLRLLKNMTQEELAISVKTKKQTIHKYETGIISNIPASKIKLIADTLNTTPAYLMGWEESEVPAEDTSDIDREFKKLLSDMSEQDKEWLLNVIKSVIDGRK